MASAAEQLAANLNFGAFAKARSSRSASGSRSARCSSIGSAPTSRCRASIPQRLRAGFQQQQPAASSACSTCSPAAPSAHGDLRAEHHALHLGLDHHAADDHRRRRARSAEEGRRAGPQEVINQYTRYLTVCWRRPGLRHRRRPRRRQGNRRRSRLVLPLSTVITLVGGTMFLMWLGEQITARGIGNGISLIIFAGIVANLPRHRRHARTRPQGALSTGSDPAHHRAGVVVIALHRVLRARPAPAADPVSEAPGRQQDVPGRSSHLPLKLNTAGVIPPIFASSLLLLPATSPASRGNAAGMAAVADSRAARPRPAALHAALCALIVFFAFFYTAIVFNPTDTADNLKKHGGFIPGHPSGRAHRRIHRLRADPHHRHRRDLSRDRLPAAGNPDFADSACRSTSAARRC
jgi:preprotein translocase subunit SecY